MSPTHTIEVADLERVLSVPPMVQTWTEDRHNYFTLTIQPSHRAHALQITTEPMTLEEGRAVCTVTPEVWSVVDRRRILAVGQCASVLAIFAGIPAVGLLWSESAASRLSFPLLGFLAGWYLVPAAIKHWKG